MIESGTIPFNDIPNTATSVAIFEHMPHSLLGCGQFVKDGCKVVLEIPHAQVIQKATGKIIITANFNPQTDTWDAYPDIKKQSEKITYNSKYVNTNCSAEYFKKNLKSVIFTHIFLIKRLKIECITKKRVHNKKNVYRKKVGHSKVKVI